MTREASRSPRESQSPHPFDSHAARPRAPGAKLMPQKPKRPPPRALRKSHLSPGRRWLVEAMQRIGFGEIQCLVVAGREPLLNPLPRLYRNHRLTGPNHRRRETELGDFVLKQRVIDLFEELDRLGDGVIAVLEVRDGLPYEMILEERPRA